MTNLPVDLVLYDMGQFLSLEMSLDCSSGSDVINTELRPGKEVFPTWFRSFIFL